jgi:G:T-mismatch repair DNA endonuclease (very short patch repair protein)
MNSKITLNNFLKKNNNTITDDLYDRILYLLDGVDCGLYKLQNLLKNALPIIIERNLSGNLRDFYIKLLSFSKGVTHNKMIFLYGEIDGNIRWESYRNKQAVSNTFEYKNKKYGMSKSEFDEYNDNRACTLVNLITRHGEELGTEKWKTYCDRQAFAGCSLEYFVDLYGKELGTSKYRELNIKKTLGIDTFIRKYGLECGTLKYKEYITNAHSPYSKISQELFWAIEKKLLWKVDSYFAEKNKEFGKMRIDTKSYYKYDYVIPKLKLCIEFNGDIYHGNPTIYAPSDIPKFRGNKKTSLELWETDVSKNKVIEDCGYVVLTIWETDFRKNPEDIINKCVEYINELYRRLL